MRDLDEAIAIVEAAGMSVVRPRSSPDEQLRGMWDDFTKTLRMAADIAADGARLKVTHPAWLASTGDAVALLRSGIVSRIDDILKTAVVEREMLDAAE